MCRVGELSQIHPTYRLGCRPNKTQQRQCSCNSSWATAFPREGLYTGFWSRTMGQLQGANSSSRVACDGLYCTVQCPRVEHDK
jgi:hypothetical protein